MGYSQTSEPIRLERDCAAVMGPQGDEVTLPAGQVGYITQALGGSFTVYVDGNLFRIRGADADALGKEPPVYAQLPLILGPDRKKLSKRNGDAAVTDYKEGGYLPEALFNFLGTLGWSLDDKTTLISRGAFIEHFDLDRVGSSPAMWDMKKLDWMNG